MKNELLTLIFIVCHVSSQSSEDASKQGASLWRQYCSRKDFDAKYVTEINRCMLRSTNLNEKLMKECVKKHLTSPDDKKSGLERLNRAQCSNDPKSNGSEKLNQSYGKYLECASGNKRKFDPCHGSSMSDRKTCMHKVLVKFAKCAHKLGILKMKK